MKPERTLQRMYNEYPRLFPVRQRALDHLFCTVGNGYSWYKGEVVSDDELYIWDNELERYIIDPDYVIDEKSDIISTPPKTEEENKKDMEEWHMSLAEMRHLVDPETPIEEHYKDLERNFLKWYPLSKDYSLIYTVPDDVTPEWKALVEECKELLRKDGIEI
jgi:hypothetical protein